MRAPTEERQVLVVTGPLRDRLYERFASLYRYRSDVLVVVDRRARERRGCSTRFADDRRRTERRRRPPAWTFPPRSA
jgi:hypothetical protein